MNSHPLQNLVAFCQQATHPLLDFWLIKLTFSALVVLVTQVYGVALYQAAVTISILIVLDTVTGVWAACKNKEFQARELVRIVSKTIQYGIFLAVVHLVQSTIPIHIYIEDIVVVFLALTEFISIIENLAKTGMSVPVKLLSKITQMRDAQ